MKNKDTRVHEPCQDALPVSQVDQLIAWNRANNNLQGRCRVCESSHMVPYEKDGHIFLAKCGYCVKTNYYNNPGHIKERIQDTSDKYWNGFFEGWIGRAGASEYLRAKTRHRENVEYSILFVGFIPSNDCLFYHRIKFIGGIGNFQLNWKDRTKSYLETFNDYSIRKSMWKFPKSEESAEKYRRFVETIKLREDLQHPEHEF